VSAPLANLVVGFLGDGIAGALLTNLAIKRLV
jgi:hypothetical protein